MNVKDEIDNLTFEVYFSIFYHDAMRRITDRADKASKILSLVLSSGAVVALLDAVNSREVALWLAVISAVVTAISVIYGWSTRYVTYSELRARYVLLQTEIEKTPHATSEDVVRLKATRRAIEKDEPPIIHSLTVWAYNTAVDALGHDPKNKRPIPYFGRILANIP